MPVSSQSFICTLVKNFDFVINKKSTSVDHLVKNSFSWQQCECWSVSCVCAQLNRKTFVVHQQKLHAAGSPPPPLQNNFATATTLTWTFKLRRAPELTYTGVGVGCKNRCRGCLISLYNTLQDLNMAKCILSNY